MWPSFSVQIYGDEPARAYAALIVTASSHFVALTDGDVLSASLGGRTVNLARLVPDDAGEAHYVAEFSPPASGSDLTFAFERPAADPIMMRARVPTDFRILESPSAAKVGEPFSVSVSQKLPVTMTGSRISWAIGYQVQVATGRSFDVPLTLDTTTSVDALHVDIPVLANRLYYWRVRGEISSVSWESWSPVDAFTVAVS